MYHKKNLDYVYLLWEDLVYQVENKNSKKNNDMCYPRFTKVIIDYFMLKDQSISRRNKMFWHIARDDPMFNMKKFISRHQDTQIYDVILPDELTNQEMLDSKAYEEYYVVASGAEPPKEKTKYKKKTDEPVTPSNSKFAPAAKEFHMSHTSGSSDGVDIPSKVPDEQQQKLTGTNEGDSGRPEAPDVPKLTQERVYTPPDHQLTNEEENQEGDDEVKEGEEEEEEEGIYKQTSSEKKLKLRIKNFSIRDDQDKDEDPSAGSNRGLKRRRSGKEAESLKEPTHKESKSIFFKSNQSKEHGVVWLQSSRDMMISYTSLENATSNDFEDKTLKICYFSITRGRSAIGSRKLPEEDQPQKPDTYRSDLRIMTPYSAYPDIQGIIYEDEMNKNRLMRTDELHKFSDGTLNHVRTALNDIATGIETDYLPNRNGVNKTSKELV
nr:hypothetical protein [Tanacetum cinerariifolium]